MTSPTTRPDLLLRLQDPEDQAAWVEFVSIYESFLDHLIRRQGVPPSHASDAKQTILMTVASGIDRFRDDGSPASFRRWLSTVGRHAAIKYMARQRRYPAGDGGTDAQNRLGELAAEDDAFERHIDHELIIWAAHQVRDQFAAASWTAFWQTMVEGRDVASVARELSLSAGSIYMSRSRILRRIRATITELAP